MSKPESADPSPASSDAQRLERLHQAYDRGQSRRVDVNLVLICLTSSTK